MKRKNPPARKPALPLCSRHQVRYELRGNLPVCRRCESEAKAGSAA